MNEKTLRDAFRNSMGVFWGQGTKEQFLGFFDERAMFVDEDNPVPMDKPGFIDHIDFHFSGIWESIGWKPREEVMKVYGSTGLVTGHFTLRDKPKSAGFRQRHGNFSLVCAWDSAKREWRGVKFHLSPLQSHIHHASPS